MTPVNGQLYNWYCCKLTVTCSDRWYWYLRVDLTKTSDGGSEKLLYTCSAQLASQACILHSKLCYIKKKCSLYMVYVNTVEQIIYLLNDYSLFHLRTV